VGRLRARREYQKKRRLPAADIPIYRRERRGDGGKGIVSVSVDRKGKERKRKIRGKEKDVLSSFTASKDTLRTPSYEKRNGTTSAITSSSEERKGIEPEV